jgi:hypothetical protein
MGSCGTIRLDIGISCGKMMCGRYCCPPPGKQRRIDEPESPITGPFGPMA